MEIHLVAPRRKHTEKKLNKGLGYFRVPPVGLLNVAAITPPDIEVKVLDDNIEELQFDGNPDLVGISVMTASADRAYDIAQRYRNEGIPVVLGGTHASVMVEEALRHSDAVVIGEAEGAWEELIEDFRKGGKEALKKTYKCTSIPDMADVPFPRLDIAKKSGNYIFTNMLSLTRGCPHNCSFCSVTQLLGKKVRLRPIPDVMEEIKSLLGTNEKKSLKDRFFVFVDDNIMANRKYAKELFTELIPYNILWVSQASINSAYDDEMLDLAAKSGCKGLFVGFESVSRESLDEIGKKQNKIDFYKEGIKKFHKRGIFVEGAFIFGFDSDGPGVFKDTVNFVNSTGLDAIQYTILTPLPGTDFYNKIEAEGRFIERRWSQYDCTHPVFTPAKMSAEDLEQGLHWAYKSTYSLWGILRRAVTSLTDPRWKFFSLLIAFNLGYRKIMSYMYKTAAKPRRQTLPGSLSTGSVPPPSPG